MKWTIKRFPGLASQIRNLAQQHREFREEPLHLAIAYEPDRDPNDIFLFELLGNFGGNEVIVRSDIRIDAELHNESRSEITPGAFKSSGISGGSRSRLAECRGDSSGRATGQF
jgi:hypothetical protein